MPVMDSRLNRNKMECGRMFADLWMKRWFNLIIFITGYLAGQKEVRTVEASSPHLEMGQVAVSVVSRGCFILLSERLLGLAAGNP